MNIPSKKDLKIVPFDMLIEEIKDRCEAGLIVAMYKKDVKKDINDNWSVITYGDFAKINLLKDYVNRVIDYDIDSIVYGGIAPK